MKHKERHIDPVHSQEHPLFTGNYLRDTSVSEYEKISEAIKFIYDCLKTKWNKKNTADPL